MNGWDLIDHEWEEHQRLQDERRAQQAREDRLAEFGPGDVPVLPQSIFNMEKARGNQHGRDLAWVGLLLCAASASVMLVLGVLVVLVLVSP